MAGAYVDLDVDGRTVRVSNPEKVFFPERGETKLDLVRYYQAVEEPFQKRVPDSRPEWLETVTVAFPSGRVALELCPVDVAHIVWAVNLGCIDLNPWPVRRSDVDHPDELRVDLDPQPGVAWKPRTPLSRFSQGKSIVLPGLLNWVSTIGWDGINNVFGAIALTILIPGLPFWVALLVIVLAQGTLGIFGYEAIHLFERWGALLLGAMFVVLTISIFGQADTSLKDGFSGLDQVGAFVAMVAIVAIVNGDRRKMPESRHTR